MSITTFREGHKADPGYREVFMQVLFQNLIVTAGKPGFGMVLSISAGAINVLLDYIFVVPMDMGIAGSALGAGIGYMIPTVIGVGFFAQPKRTLHFQKPFVDFHVQGTGYGTFT